MGMSASQVRFLSLQNRKNDIGNELMTLSNRKMALSRDMNKVSDKYTHALNKTNFKYSNDMGITTNELTYDLLMKPNELNPEFPIILTDQRGRVVVDDTKITIPAIGDEEAQTLISYRELAELISTYSGAEKNGATQGTVHYDYTTRVKQENGKAVEGLGMSDPTAYVITNNFKDFHYNDALRMDLFQKMGIITDAQLEEYKETLNALYGNDEVRSSGSYEALLKQFDNNKNMKIAGASCEEIFGKLDPQDSSTGALSISGGNAYANLELAKAYQKEYQAYLNTFLRYDILADTSYSIGSSTVGNATDQLDWTNFTMNNNYRYNESENTGISFRMIDLLNKSNQNDFEVSGNNYKFKADSLMKNLGIYYYAPNGDTNGEEWARQCATINGLFINTTPINKIWYDANGNGSYDNSETIFDKNNSDPSQNRTLQDWSSMFDYSPAGSFDSISNPNGVYTGAEALTRSNHNPGSASSPGVVLQFDSIADANAVSVVVRRLISSFDASVSQIGGMNQEAINFAHSKMLDIWANVPNSNGNQNDTKDKLRCVYNNGSKTCYINMTNFISSFWTLYAMYDAVDREDGVVSNNNPSDFSTAISNRIEHSNNSRNIAIDALSDMRDFHNVDIAKLCLANNNNIDSTTLLYYVQNYKQGYDLSTAVQDGVDSDTGKKRYVIYKNNSDGTKSKLTVSGDWDENRKVFTNVYRVQEDLYDRNMKHIAALENDVYYANKGTIGASKIVKQLDGSYKDIATVELAVLDGNLKSIITFDKSGGVYYGADGTKLAATTSNPVKFGINPDGYANTIDYEQSANGGTLTSTITNNMYYYKKYYIQDPNNSDEKDSDYNYQIIMNDFSHSDFAAVIYKHPEDKYSSALEGLVATCQNRVNELEQKLETFFSGYQAKMMEYYDAVFKRIAEKGWVYDENLDSEKTSNKYMNAMLQNNLYYLTEARETNSRSYFKYTIKLASNVSRVFQMHDESAENEALAEYTTKKAAINSKEKKIDRKMRMLETEQEAINTEMESVKKIKDDNVDRFFKIFA